MERYLPQIAADFARLPVTGEKKVRVGVVGEIYVKYSPIGNNDLEEFLFSQGCGTMVPGVIGFMLFKGGQPHGGHQAVRRQPREIQGRQDHVRLSYRHQKARDPRGRACEYNLKPLHGALGLCT